jgi:hypothetical protein
VNWNLAQLLITVIIVQTLLMLIAQYAVILIVFGLMVLIGRAVWFYTSRW